MARRRRLVLSVWIVVLLGCALSYPTLNARLQAPDFGMDNSESARVDQLAAQHFPQLGVEQDVITFDSPTTTVDAADYRAAIDAAVHKAQAISGVRTVVGPFDGNPAEQISANRHAAFAVVSIDGSAAQRADIAAELQTAMQHTATNTVRVGVTGYSAVQNDLVDVERHDVEKAEAIGIPVALVLLVLALGAVAAAMVPVGVALAGILLAFGVMFLLSSAIGFDSLVVSMATMIGTGVGIDYAMFVVSRFREELTRANVESRADHERIAHAVGIALGTAGRTIVASGLIVMISLCSLVVMRSPVFRGIAIGVATAVLCTLAVALTLLPALLATLGPTINRGGLPERLQPAEVHDPQRSGWARWAHAMMAHPVLFGGLAIAVLVVAAWPITGIRYGIDMSSAAIANEPSGRASAVISHNFSSGLLAPVEVLITGPDDTPMDATGMAAANQFVDRLRHDPRVSTVVPLSLDGRMIVNAIPAVAFDSTPAANLVREIRTEGETLQANGGPQVMVGGISAEFVDISNEITGKLPLVIALVLACSIVFLTIVFRSVVLPIKAIVMNLLATGAALGITVAIFQWGVGETVLDFRSPGFLQVFLPTLVFAVLFGLSMDYEVFLISRMKETWDATGDNRAAVATGLAHTARPITAAAAIMVVVFGSFVTANVLELKQIGLALAVAVAIDALIVRLILVPALMRLFGKWNWWLP
ncbi:MMPL family transporter [Skermania sp. ID1734]|nr:MMPL family transporter [Skermania sp. ID1734]